MPISLCTFDSIWWKISFSVFAGIGACLLSQRILEAVNWRSYSIKLKKRRDSFKDINVSKLNDSIKQDEETVERSDIPDNAPESCPGVYSEHAGQKEACDGCPNQVLCTSGDARKPDPTLTEKLKHLNDIKHKILVLSGKGGVGKSTVSSQLAWALQERGFEVGLLDVDICGPSIPMMTGTMRRDIHLSADGWEPIYVEPNFAVMSIGFLLPSDEDAVIWRGPKKNAMIRQFLTDVAWRELDFLIIDTPPGTSDEHLSIVSFLKESGVDGALVVTTPQEVSLQDVRKEINFCKKVNIEVLGVIENMSDSIFTSKTGGGEKMADAMGVPYVGSIPMDKALLDATEEGVFVNNYKTDSVGGRELSRILDELLRKLGEPVTAVHPTDCEMNDFICETSKEYMNESSTNVTVDTGMKTE